MSTVVHALIVPVKGPASYLEIGTDLDSPRDTIGGGWLEMIKLSDGHAYLDEEGKLKGLPFNECATRLANSFGWQADDVLCGPVVFLGDGEDGEEADVPNEIVLRALKDGLF